MLHTGVSLLVQETFDAGLQAFQQEGIANITALKDQLLAAKHVQSKAIEARHAALMKRWSQLLANSAARKKKLLEAQSHFRKVSVAPAKLKQLKAQGGQTHLPGRRFCPGAGRRLKPRQGGDPCSLAGLRLEAPGPGRTCTSHGKGRKTERPQQWDGEKGGQAEPRASPCRAGTLPRLSRPRTARPPAAVLTGLLCVQVEDLFLTFAKKASAFNSWFENAEEDLTDPVRCNSLEEIKALREAHDAFRSSLSSAQADFNQLAELDRQIKSFRVASNPYTWFTMEALEETWRNLQKIIKVPGRPRSGTRDAGRERAFPLAGPRLRGGGDDTLPRRRLGP